MNSGWKYFLQQPFKKTDEIALAETALRLEISSDGEGPCPLWPVHPKQIPAISVVAYFVHTALVLIAVAREFRIREARAMFAFRWIIR